MSVYEQVVTTKISQHSTCPREVACYIVNTQGEAGFLRFCTCCAIEVQASQHQPQSSRGYMPLQLATTGVDHNIDARWLCNYIRCQHQGWQDCCGFAHVSQVKQPASQHQPHNRRGSWHAQRSFDTLLCVNNKDEAGLRRYCTWWARTIIAICVTSFYSVTSSV